MTYVISLTNTGVEVAAQVVERATGPDAGAIKAAVDDHTQSLVDEARPDDPDRYRGGFFPLGDFNFRASDNAIRAMTIASYGGAVRCHRNGARCFIRDARGRLVCDYQPQGWVETYYPILPLTAGTERGRMRWSHMSR